MKNVIDTETGKLVEIDLSHGDFFGRYRRATKQEKKYGKLGLKTTAEIIKEAEKETQSKLIIARDFAEEKIGKGKKSFDKHDLYIMLVEYLVKVENTK